MLNFSDHASDLRGIFSGNGLLHSGKAQAHQGGTNLLRAADAALYLGNCYCITHDSTNADQIRIIKIQYLLKSAMKADARQYKVLCHHVFNLQAAQSGNFFCRAKSPQSVNRSLGQIVRII